jgi:uncharacterized protein YukE
MSGTIIITPENLVEASQYIQARVDEAVSIAKSYLATQQNAMGAQTWSGQGTQASNAVATQVAADLQKVLTGGGNLAQGLYKAAQIMAAGDFEDEQAYQSLFDGSGGAQSV